jgi:hypothetical protein
VQKIRLHIIATLISGEKLDSGVQFATAEELATDSKGYDGNPMSDLEEAKELLELILTEWNDMDYITIDVPGRGPIKVRTEAVAYVEGSAEIVEDAD